LNVLPTWDLGIFAPALVPKAPNLRGSLHFGWSDHSPEFVELEWHKVPGAEAYRVYSSGIALICTTTLRARFDPGLPGVEQTYYVCAESLGGGSSSRSNQVTLGYSKPRRCHLSDFTALRSFTGYGELLRDRQWDGSALRLGNREFAKGLWAHLDSEAVYFLGGKYGSLGGFAGIAPSHPEGEGIFSIEADGHVIWESSLLKGTSIPAEFNVKVTGVQVLRLLTHGPRTIGQGHALWSVLELIP